LRGRWLPDISSEAAERGTRIHDALEAQDIGDLEHNEALTTEKCNDIISEIVDRVIVPQLEPGEQSVTERETRVQSFAGIYRYSGKWDLLDYWKQSKVAIVADYKTGPRGAEHAAENYQLASLAVLAAQRHGMPKDTKLYVAIVSPLKHPNYTMASYTVKDLPAIEDALANIAEHAHNPYAPASAGDHCRYCPARHACEERNELVGEMARIETPTAITDPLQFAELLNLGDLAVSAHKEHRAFAKTLLMEDKITIPGWKLQKTKGRSKIKPEPLMTRMGDEGYLTAMLGTMVSVTKKGLTQVVRTKTGKAGKELESEVKRLLDGCSEDGKPSLSLVKE